MCTRVLRLTPETGLVQRAQRVARDGCAGLGKAIGGSFRRDAPAPISSGGPGAGACPATSRRAKRREWLGHRKAVGHTGPARLAHELGQALAAGRSVATPQGRRRLRPEREVGFDADQLQHVEWVEADSLGDPGRRVPGPSQELHGFAERLGLLHRGRPRLRRAPPPLVQLDVCPPVRRLRIDPEPVSSPYHRRQGNLPARLELQQPGPGESARALPRELLRRSESIDWSTKEY